MMVYTPEQIVERMKAEEKAAAEINHIGDTMSEHMTDYHVCSCGWKSRPYEDGAHWAREEWIEHIKNEGAEIVYPELTK